MIPTSIDEAGRPLGFHSPGRALWECSSEESGEDVGGNNPSGLKNDRPLPEYRWPHSIKVLKQWYGLLEFIGL